jgi:TonB family protein
VVYTAGMLRLSALAAALALMPVLAQAQDRNPDWLVKPDAEMIASHYPPFALWLEVTGRAVIACKVSPQGRLFDCEVVEETPAALGFGKAAVEMASGFLMQPRISGGKAVEGSVRIPLAFTLPEDEADEEDDDAETKAAKSKPSAKPTAKAQELAMGIALEQAQVIEAYTAMEAMADTMAEQMPDKAMRELVAEAIREAASDALIDARDGYAKAYTDTFTEAELVELAAFYQSPFGKMLKEKLPVLYASVEVLMEEVMDKMRDGARERLCPKLGCPPSPPPSPK